ncbi:uncharacterized protein [Choristoneura fumiferana]|uniref:uncharacterized protein n=1 Tax=Choristoneura fumiferana TaxID=7141 RepID=UPI003D15B3D8
MELTPINEPLSIMEPSPFNVEITASFENSPMPSMSTNDVINCLNVNVLTPMPSPLNKHSDQKCNDAFCVAHEIWQNTVDEASSKPRQSKKRKRNVSNWSDVKRKVLKNKGKAFINRAGNVVEQKVLGPPCICRYKCFEKLTPANRQQIFSKFWAISSKEKQWLFVVNNSTKQKKTRCLNREGPNNRQFTITYFLPLILSDNVGSTDKIKVCKTMFLNTIGMSGKIIKTAWEKYDGGAVMAEDQRGRHQKHKRIIVDEMKTSVCDHVKAFEPIESHYLREKTTKLYLDGSLSISRMFTMYKDWVDSEKYPIQAKTERQYRDIVNENFNLGFFCPKKDQCDQCHTYRNIANPSQEQIDAFEQHQARKKLARDLKKNDKITSQESDGATVSAVFDFEKVLTCPFGQVSIFYYKKKLSCFNFTLFDMGRKRAVCYMWDETVAKRGANEVSSCLLDFIEANARDGVRFFLFWSDNCPGQNRNRFVYSSYVHAANQFHVSITHRFMEKGHTQNEGDSVHSAIENAARTKKIYTPKEWQLLVRWAKNSTECPYEVRDMTKDDFYDFKDRVSDKLWSKNIRGQKVKWNSIKEVHVAATDPNKLCYKYDLSAEHYDTIAVGSTTRNSNNNANLKKCYNDPLQIPFDKYKDLMSLCDSDIIPRAHHDYFKNIPHCYRNGTITETE